MKIISLIMIKINNNFFSSSKQSLRPSSSLRQDIRRKKSLNTQIRLRNKQITLKTQSSYQVYTPKKIIIQSPKNMHRNTFGTSSNQNNKKISIESRSFVKSRKMSSSYSKVRSKEEGMKNSSQFLQKFSQYSEQFLNKMSQIQEQYIESYSNQQYQKAASCLIKILNYSIDFNLIKFFIRTIKQIGEFYFLVNKINYAIFYFNQTIICGFLLNEPDIIIQTIIRSSQCCIRFQMYDEALVMLKKGLETCWFFKKSQQELNIYDQIGKLHYLKGQLWKALQYHNKFIDACNQPQNSPQRTLSRQRISKWIIQNNIKVYYQIDLIFLANLTLPILNFTQLPPLLSAKQKIRNQFKINTKYVDNLSDFGVILTKILQQQFFHNQIQDPQSLSPRKSYVPKKRTHDLIQLKLKQHLRQLGIGTDTKIELRPSNVEYKELLEDKVKRKLKQPGLDRNWQQKMIKQIKRDRQNKIFKIKSQIRVRGKNRTIRPEVDHIRKLFLPLYQ